MQAQIYKIIWLRGKNLNLNFNYDYDYNYNYNYDFSHGLSKKKVFLHFLTF